MSLKEQILSTAQKALKAKSAFPLYISRYDKVNDQGFTFIFHYYDSKLKEYLNVLPTERKDNPLLPPFDPNLHVCDLTNGSRHHVIINKYMQCEGHIVLSSMDKEAKQGSKLTLQDFKAFEEIFQNFNDEGMLYYNSGLNSGCSQLHKHLQYTPVEELPILDAMIDKKLPIYYHVLDVEKTKANKMLSVYNELLKLSKNDPIHDSYNFIISRGKAFYIPRKKSFHKSGMVLNSFAISGNFSMWEDSDQSIKNQALSILEDVCFPIVK